MKRPASFLILLIAPMACCLAGCNEAPTAPAPLAPTSDVAAPADTPSTATVVSAPAAQAEGRAASREPDVVFVPTPHDVVDKMLEVANVGPKDVLYDLGSGDGRIPVAAAKRWGTRGVGIDIDPKRIGEANQAAEAAKVTDKVRFIEGDLFVADLSPATVVTLYLLPDLNLRLRPRLLRLKPGTRIVSHNYHMGDWEPEKTVQVGGSTVYFWTVPETLPANLR